MQSQKNFLLVILSGVLLFASAQISPVEIVDANAYFGTWIQAYGSRSALYTFELGGKCTTAEYGPTDIDGTISVRNSVRAFGFFPWSINGFAAQSPTTQGSFSVSLDFFGGGDAADAEFEDPGNYWIVELGPIVNNQYDWSIVSDADQRTLYVLTRDMERFESLYEQEVLDKVEAYGFTSFFNEPIKNDQHGC